MTTSTTNGHRALRRGRVSLCGQSYFITVTCLHRRVRFVDFDAACAVSRILGSARAWRGAQVLAWVLMPDHWHALITLEDADLSRVIQQVNSLTARAANAAIGSQGQVWQSTFHDHAIRADEDIKVAARYLVANPIRAHLAGTIAEYPFWDAVWLDPQFNPLDP